MSDEKATVTDEFARIAAIQRRLAREREDVLIGIGDDAAVLAGSGASQVLTVDVAIDGVHFRRDWASWREIGHRAFVCAASDVAAMGGSGRASLLALILPRDFSDEDLAELTDGVAEGADECGAPVVGGNLGAGGELSITTTVIGQLAGAPLTRSGARVGDGVYVTGSIGGAGLGVALLERGYGGDDRASPFVSRWRRPVAQFVVGQRLVGVATACVDVSDGLLQDLGHICAASGVGARLYERELPLPPGFRALAEELGLDPIELALTAGDDYELVFTAPASIAVKGIATRIGEVRPAEDDIRVVDEDGRARTWTRRGYRHFSD